MKERGLGTGALVAIIVGIIVAVVVPVSIAAVLLLGGGGGPGGLPVYSGATKVGGDVSYMGATASVYSFTDNAETVYDWYESNTPAGWTLHENSGYIGSISAVVWEKGNDYGFAVVFEGTYAQQYGAYDKVLILGAGPKSVFES